MNERAADSLIGAVIDQRYVVAARLAHGGMSTVYRATDRRLDRDVALKVLYPHLAADPTFLTRLEREAKAAARLSHPHVVGVLDQGVDGELAYLVMEYVPGHTLRDRLQQQGALTPRQALDLIDPVVEGLGAAHAAGLIHRDIKPENVLLSTDGRIKLADFGLARAAANSTGTGTLMGTVAYMAPELVTGADADARADVYSTGIMLFELLTGQQPFTGDMPVQVAFQHVHSTVPAPSELRPGLAADLDELVQWCTAGNPDQRPIDGNALLGELRHIRASLTPEELDFRDNAEHVPSAGHGTTTIHLQGAGALPTEIIRPSSNPTTVMERGTALQVEDGDVEDGDVEDGDPPELPFPGTRSPRRRALVVALVILLSLLAAGAGWFFGVGPGASVTMPDLRNRTLSEARVLLAEAGLEYTSREVFDERVGKGRVVRTDPEGSNSIRKFDPVTLILSKGPELFAVPRVVGEDDDAAGRALSAVGLKPGKVSEAFHEKVPAGLVLSQSVTPERQVRRNTVVDLVVSKGPRPVDVPAVTGLPGDRAAQVLNSAGLRPVLAAEAVFDRNVPAGHVSKQSPAGGQLKRGDAVTLTLSKGPRMVKVPDFIGRQVGQARRELESLGFRVEVDNILGGFFGTVRDQDPVDESVPEGSTVTLTVV